MAHFPPEHADAAIEACMKVLQDLRDRRATHPSGLARFLFGGFGLTEGQVIEGNIGSTIKLDYTLLGDPVNLAARLEALTRTIRRAIAIGGSIRQRTKQPWPFECVGEFRLKGHDEPCTVYSLDDPLVLDFRDHLEPTLAMASIGDK